MLFSNTLLEKDANKDGVIDLKEYLGDAYEQPTSEWFITEKVRFTEEYDKDKNGFLSGDELKEWLMPDIRHTARQEAQHLIKTADDDRHPEQSNASFNSFLLSRYHI
uniref:EF-hand domain-containing protein n=1 Tax=Ditylenchus dipsaci TaxID=166011 RepID=A0A915D213_9BILA